MWMNGTQECERLKKMANQMENNLRERAQNMGIWTIQRAMLTDTNLYIEISKCTLTVLFAYSVQKL